MLAEGAPIATAGEIDLRVADVTGEDPEQVESLVTSLQRSMWNNAGLLRDESNLLQGLADQEECTIGLDRLAKQGKGSRRITEAQALCRVANAILRTALARIESRGAHFRNDYPHRDDAQFQKHSVLAGALGATVRFEKW
jgi:L-aspartate oxidase